MNWRTLFRARPAPSVETPDIGQQIAEAVAAERSAASRAGYRTMQERERAKIRATTIRLANQIGRPELAEPLQSKGN